MIYGILKENIHRTAIYWARKNNHPEIVDLLSKGPIKSKS